MIGVGKSEAPAEVKAIPGPPLPAMFARYRSGLDGELRATMPYLDSGVGRAEFPASFYRMLQYHMGWADANGDRPAAPVSQGKALRPTLCLFACEALGCDWATALPTATALELIHNFSLIHDDIQDGDVERRHRPTVWALWGQAQALLAGDAMRSLADISALELSARGVPEEKALKVSSLLTRGYLDMTHGQCLDLAFEGRLDIGLEDYLGMISYKTGALIRCAMETGALIGSDEEAWVRSFAHCGGLLGLAFQIRDDVLGIWGDEDSTGKAVGNDIRRKKKSFPIVYALEVARGASRQTLVSAYSKDSLGDRDVEDVLTVLDDLRVADYARNAVRENACLAHETLRSVPLLSWARQEIEELVEFLPARQH